MDGILGTMIAKLLPARSYGQTAVSHEAQHYDPAQQYAAMVAERERQQRANAQMALARSAQQEAESLARTQARVGQIIPQASARFEGGGRALPLSGGGVFSGYRPPAATPFVGSLGPDPLGRRWR